MSIKNIYFNDLRIQILNKNLIRIEKKFNGSFVDSNTFFILNREQYSGEDFQTKESNNSLEILFNEHKLVVPKVGYKGIALYRNNEKIYKFKPIANSGELPPSFKTPDVFALNDAPHIFVPAEGYSVDAKTEYKVDENEFDMYLMIINKDHKLLRKMYVELTGRSDLVRFKTLGLWHSRYYKYNDLEAKGMMDKFKEYNLPLDNFVIDTDWRKANDIGIGYEVDTNLFPNMKEVFDYAHNKNVTVMFNDHPEPLYKKLCVFDKEEIEFREYHLQKLLSMGLDTWWYDRNWTTKLISPSSLINPETFGMYLFNDITKNYYKSLSENYIRPDIMANVNNIANGDYIKIYDSASHRYGIQWTGDISCSRSSITSEVNNLVRASMNCVSYVHYDVGGHVGNPSKELYLDWIKFGVFTPVFRLHCCNNVERFREPWNYDLETIDIFREYINMRYRLLGYLYSLCFNNYLNGEPMFKSLNYNYPNNKNVRNVYNEYLFGNNILVVPYGENVSALVKLSNYVSPVKARYYNNRDLYSEVLIEKEYKTIDFVWNHVKPEKEVPMYDFSAVYETSVKFNENVKLFVKNDDGVRVYVNDKLLVDDWTYHGALENFILHVKKDEIYNLKIEYLQGGGEASIQLVYIEDQGETKVVLPDNKWIDAFDGKIYSKYNQPLRRSSLNDISLFVREGSLIPLVKAKNNTSDIKLDDLILEYYPSKTEKDSGFIYEDDKTTVAYKDGYYRTTNYSSCYNSEENAFVIKINKANGNFVDEVTKREILLKFHSINGVESIKNVTINGQNISYELVKKDSSLYPFNEAKGSQISDLIAVEFTSEINQSYTIKIYLK